MPVFKGRMMTQVENKRQTKSLYVLKSCEEELERLQAKKKSETKNLYVVRTNDEIVNKYSDIIYDFVDLPGVFVVISQDKSFVQTFRGTISQALGIEPVFVQCTSDLGRASELIRYFVEKDIMPFVFMEHSMNSELTLSYMRFFRAAYEKVKVCILSRELSRERLFQFYEDGANSFLKKPASINAIITKIAFMLKPQTEADSLIEEGRDHLRDRRYEEAIEVANKVLNRWPKNAAAMVLYGDAKRGLDQRREALSAYAKAERNSKNYLEPLQRMATIHREDENVIEAIKCLKKLDKLSPLNCTRKIQIAELHYDAGDAVTAEQYFDNAINSAREEALAVVGEMSLDIAEMLSKRDPKMAAKYYRQSLDFVKSSKSQMAMTIYNRLGISLRKQGLWQEAVEAYLEAARYAPKDENIQYNIGLAYAEGEKYAEGAARMSMALSINPEMYHDRPELAYQFGMVFAKASNEAEARRCLEYLNGISPGYKDSGELLQSIAG